MFYKEKAKVISAGRGRGGLLLLEVNYFLPLPLQRYYQPMHLENPEPFLPRPLLCSIKQQVLFVKAFFKK